MTRTAPLAVRPDKMILIAYVAASRLFLAMAAALVIKSGRVSGRSRQRQRQAAVPAGNAAGVMQDADVPGDRRAQDVPQ